MKTNVLAYLTNGNVVRLCVQFPEVGLCNNGNRVGIFAHYYYGGGDDYDEWYEDIAIYYIYEVACIYVDGKCVWYNPMYIDATPFTGKSQEELYSKSLDLDINEEYVEGMFDFSDQDPLYY